MNYTNEELNQEITVELKLPTPSRKREIEGVYRALTWRDDVVLQGDALIAFQKTIYKTSAPRGSIAEHCVNVWEGEAYQVLSDLSLKIGSITDPKCKGWRWKLIVSEAPAYGVIPKQAKLVFVKENCGIAHAQKTYSAMINTINAEFEEAQLKAKAIEAQKASLAYQYGHLLENELRAAKKAKNEQLKRKLRVHIFEAEDVFDSLDRIKSKLTKEAVEQIRSLGFVKSAKTLEACLPNPVA